MRFQVKQTYAFSIAVLFAAIFLCPQQSAAQTDKSDSSKYITLPAARKYYKNSFYKFLWGEHYRKEWHTPVTMPKVKLDTIAGGLEIYQVGGSRQTQSLRVTDSKDREYVFRSVDKTLGGALPEIFRGTFIEDMANDQVTLSHPYAALIVAPLAKAADIFHATPALYYVPKQPALGIYNDSMGNLAYFFEQRPDENWSTEENFGNSKKIISTENMLEKILKDNDDHVDQYAFVRARLFDMFIGDGGRHEDQWRWATFKNGKTTIYKPIPRDRDNAMAKYEGFLLERAIKAANAIHLQTFDYKIKNLDRYNFPARNLDRHLMNALSLSEWLAIAADLQKRLTDPVIENAVKQMPPEVYPITGPELTAKLKSRRDDLQNIARAYFLFISYEVEITTSEKNDQVNINRLSDTTTEVTINKITKQGEVKEKPYYHRIFDNRETKEVRIYGLEGEDQWNITGNVNKGIKFRLIGGADKDVYNDNSSIKLNGRRTIIYDDKGDNSIKGGSEINTHLSNDPQIHDYKYDYFNPSYHKVGPSIFYSNADRIFVGLHYINEKQQWRKNPYGQLHYVDLKYSIAQKAFSSRYTSRFRQLFGKVDLNLFGEYDQLRWTNFFGLGNETLRTTNDATFYRFRTREFLGKVGVERVIRNRHRLTLNGLFQTYDIIRDNDRFLSKVPGVLTPQTFTTQKFYGAEAQYLFQRVNDSTLPTRGLNFVAYSNYTQNFDIASNHVLKFGAETNLYFPLSRKFSISVKAGGNDLVGNPQFFQYNILSNNNELRGFQRNRFYGNRSVYNQNELRYITPVRSHLYNGKIGVFALYDQARVFLDGENSNTLHAGYGGGIILSPFNFITVSAAYAVSKNESGVSLRVMKVL